MNEATTKERPILFSGPMVQAIIEGRKTQTRRVVKPQPELSQGWELQVPGPQSKRALAVCWDCMRYGVEPGSPSHNHRWDTSKNWRVPYGVPGDRLYVRENLRWEQGASDVIHGVEMQDPATLLYEADDAPVQGGEIDEFDAFSRRCRRDVVPSIHMPRWASRLTLEITGVRVERLQSISEQDARAEGVLGRVEFVELWKSINGDKSWAENPWVWVVEFKKQETRDE